MSLYIKTLGHFNRMQLNLWSGIVFLATFLVSSWMAPIWGKFADRYGRKKVMLISAAGMLLGPLFGGAIAGAFGYRVTFFLTGLAYATVFPLTLFLYMNGILLQ